MTNKHNLSKTWDSYSKINRKKKEELKKFPFHNKIQPKKSDFILDIGCGAGAYISMFSKYSDNVFGIDISPQMVLSSRSYSNKICLADLRLLPFKSEIFDFTYSMVAINYVKNWDKSILEMERVLKPGGYCLITSANTYSIMAPLRTIFHFFKAYKYGATYHASIAAIEGAGKRSNLIVEKTTTQHRIVPFGKTAKSILYSVFTRIDHLISTIFPHWGAESIVLFKKSKIL